MKTTSRHTFECSADTFWDKIFFDPEFNRKLYAEVLKFPDYAVLEQKDTEKDITRRLRATPPQETPAAIQKILGGAFSYVEEGRFDKARKVYTFNVVPATMADRIKTSGEFRVEARGAKQCERIVETLVEVKVFGVGGIAEGFVEKNLRDTYEAAARFTNQWIREKGF